MRSNPAAPAVSVPTGRRRLTPDSLLRLAVAGVLLVMAASGLALHLWGVDLLEHLPGHPICPFRAVTSLPCPGCGMTRAVLALGQGRVLAAARFNPLVLPLVAAMLAWLAGVRLDAARRRAALTVLLGAVLVFWAARLWLAAA